MTIEGRRDMKLAKEIAEELVEFAADRNGDVCACELEPLIAAKLRPIRDALHMMWDNPESMTASDIAAQYADAVEMLKETEHVAE